MRNCESCFLFSQKINMETCAGCIERKDGVLIFHNWISGVRNDIEDKH